MNTENEEGENISVSSVAEVGGAKRLLVLELRDKRTGNLTLVQMELDKNTAINVDFGDRTINLPMWVEINGYNLERLEYRVKG